MWFFSLFYGFQCKRCWIWKFAVASCTQFGISLCLGIAAYYLISEMIPFWMFCVSACLIHLIRNNEKGKVAFNILLGLLCNSFDQICMCVYICIFFFHSKIVIKNRPVLYLFQIPAGAEDGTAASGLEGICQSSIARLGLCNKENSVFPGEICTSFVMLLCVPSCILLPDKLSTVVSSMSLHKMSMCNRKPWPDLTVLRYV